MGERLLASPILKQDSSAKFLPAFFVDVVALGQQFNAGELPLHMTYFPPLRAELSQQHVKDMRHYLNPLPPLELQVTESAYFGDDNNQHVKRVKRTPRVLVAHRALVSAVGRLPHDMRYRMPFNPHITIAEDDTAIQTGDSIEVGGVSIIVKPENSRVWTVMAKIGLKGGLQTT